MLPFRVVVQERFAGQSTPRREILRRTGIERAQAKDLSRAHRLDAEAQTPAPDRHSLDLRRPSLHRSAVKRLNRLTS